MMDISKFTLVKNKTAIIDLLRDFKNEPEEDNRLGPVCTVTPAKAESGSMCDYCLKPIEEGRPLFVLQEIAGRRRRYILDHTCHEEAVYKAR